MFSQIGHRHGVSSSLSPCAAFPPAGTIYSRHKCDGSLRSDRQWIVQRTVNDKENVAIQRISVVGAEGGAPSIPYPAHTPRSVATPLGVLFHPVVRLHVLDGAKQDQTGRAHNYD